MDFDPSTHPHRRWNPLTNEHVLVSPHRNKRPWQGQTEPPNTNKLEEYDPTCYLCPGNARSGGHQNPAYESTMAFENDFPALLSPPGPIPPPSSHPLLQTQPVQGACDVIIFHPRHDLTLARLSTEEIERIISEWQAIYLKRGNQEGIEYVQIFENKGAMMGCSNPHPHGQVWSLSQVPTLARTELDNLHKYAQATQLASQAPLGPLGKPCLLCEYVHYEQSAKERVVLSNEHWTALVPYWAVWPFEILLLPHNRHIPSIADLTQAESTSLATILSQLTTRYDNLFSTSFAYSMGMHQRPVPPLDTATASIPLEREFDGTDIAHLHLHFAPPLLRSASVRKFLVGFELMGEPQRDLTPEQAADKLRECAPRHYLDEQEMV